MKKNLKKAVAFVLSGAMLLSTAYISPSPEMILYAATNKARVSDMTLLLSKMAILTMFSVLILKLPKQMTSRTGHVLQTAILLQTT